MTPAMDLITPDYLQSQKALHAAPRGYGGGGSAWCGAALWVRDQYQAVSILDYGCGQGTLSTAIQVATGTGCREYDPAIPGKDALPEPADLVICTDVLEHIQPHLLDNVLAHLRSVARKAVLLVVSTRLANKTLPDGRNAHLIVESGEWWRARVEAAGFTVRPEPPIHPAKRPGKAWVAVLEP